MSGGGLQKHRVDETMRISKKSSLEHKKPNNYVNDDTMYVEGALALILRLSRCAGLAPIRTRRARTGWLFHASPAAARLQALVMTLINTMMLLGVILDFCQKSGYRIRIGETLLQAFVWLSDLVLVMVTASIIVYRGTAQMESLKQVLQELQQIKLDLKINGVSTKSDKTKCYWMIAYLMWIISVMFTDFVSHCIRVRSKEDTEWRILLLYGVYYIADLQGVLAVVKWACTAAALQDAAANLNHHVQKLRYGSEFLTRPSRAETLIRRLALSNVRLSDMMRQMNDANGLILMLILMSTFLRLVITPYYMLIQLYSSKLLVLDVTLSLNWSLVHMSHLILIIEPCQWTHSQREHTGVLLSHLIVHLAPKCERLSKELDEFTKQIMLNNAKFMTLGVYTLDRPLMATILGGVTTYLVILIQFQTISNQL